MSKLEEIRNDFNIWGYLPGDDDLDDPHMIHSRFLLRAVGQLVKYIRAMRKTAPYPSVQRRLLEQILDPDIRELAEDSGDDK